MAINEEILCGQESLGGFESEEIIDLNEGCDCDCDCGSSDDCDHDDGCDCGCESDEVDGETTITMTDAEGNEYEFMLYDELSYNDETYLLLLTLDDEDPELVIVKVVVSEDGNDSLMSVDEEEFDLVFAEYERLCEEEEDDEDDEDEDDEE